MIDVIRLVNLRRFRRQRRRALLAVSAVAAATALTVALLVTMTSVDRSLDEFGRSLAGPTPLRVVGMHNHGALDAGLAADLAAVPGVEAAIPVVQTVVNAVAEDGSERSVLAIGLDCSVQSVIDVTCSPEAVANAADTEPPLVSRSLGQALGAGSLETDLVPIPLAGSNQLDQLDELNEGRVVVLALPQAQRVFVRPGTVDAIYIALDGTVPEDVVRVGLEAVAGPEGRVLDRNDPVDAATDSGVTIPLLALIALATLALGWLLVHNSAALDLEERRGDLAVVSVVGGSRRLVATGILVEAAIVGSVGGFAGGIVGTLLARPMVASISQQYERAGGVVLGTHASVGAVVVGVLTGVLLSALAAVPVTRRATRLHIAEELRQHRGQADAPPTRPAPWTALVASVIGLGSVAVTALAGNDGGLSGWAPVASYLGVAGASAGLLVAAAAWAPAITNLTARARRWPMGRAPLARLALTNVNRHPVRTASMAAAVAVAVALGGGLANFLPANRAGVSEAFGRLAQDRLHLTTIGLIDSSNTDSRPSPTLLESVATIDGVAAVDRTYHLALVVDGRTVSVNAYDGLADGFEVLDGPPAAAALAADELLVGPAFARSQGVGPGDVVELPTLAGPRRLTVGAVWAHPDRLGDSITLRSDLLQSLWGTQPPTGAFVRAAEGVDAAGLADRIRAAGLSAQLEVRTPAEYTADLSDDIAGYIEPFLVVQRLLFVVVLVATTATLLLVGAQRRREQGVLAAIGLGARALGRLVASEAAVVGVVGAALGLAAGVALTVALTNVAGVLFGLRPPLRIEVFTGLLHAGLGVVTVVVASLLPARNASRMPVVEVLRDE